jgi:hypothetical protein
MNPPTKLAITGVGRGADAAGVPDACARNGADRVLHHRRIGQHGVRPDSAREELLIAFSGTRAPTTLASRRQTWRRKAGCAR